jgi:hypothetical protein
VTRNLKSFAPTQIDESYWESYGWWVRLVDDLFGFLGQFGYRLAKIHIHQEGNFMKYSRGPDSVVFYYEPDLAGDFGVAISRDGSRPLELDSLLADQEGTLRPPPKLPTQESVESNLRFWAEHLRTRGASLLR